MLHFHSLFCISSLESAINSAALHAKPNWENVTLLTCSRACPLNRFYFSSVTEYAPNLFLKEVFVLAASLN